MHQAPETASPGAAARDATAADFLGRLPLFTALPRADLERLCSMVQDVRLAAGEVLMAEGDPGDAMYVIAEGEFEVVKESGDRQVVLARRVPGDFIGEMSLLEQAPRTATVRALADSRVFRIGQDSFRQLLTASPGAAGAILRTVGQRLRSTEAVLVQREKMAALGTLAAGLAHELNNPAAAVGRAAGQLRALLEAWQQAVVAFDALGLDGERAALARRLEHTRAKTAVLGVSGGLDSTLALLAAVKTFDLLGRDRGGVIGVTMPGFGTTGKSHAAAREMMRVLGVSSRDIDIKPACLRHFADIGHDPEVHDTTFENVQAGLRTDYLFRLANHHHGIVLGTGDLSELALGWCTYGVGDQMSHYGVNAGVPKTLMQHLIRWVINTGQFEESGVNETLSSILNTEISPELIPVGEGQKPQSTEDSIGPYALHDFTLFGVLRRGYRPSKIAFLAHHAWRDVDAGHWPSGYPEADRTAYDLPTVKKWMAVFLRRFFANQFKRSAIPNGPKVLSGGALSPRGDWRMPSDVSATAWLAKRALMSLLRPEKFRPPP